MNLSMAHDDSTTENIVTCKHCNKPYFQRTEEQAIGARAVDDDTCPYCGESNGRSGDVEFFNKPLSDGELKARELA